MAGLSQYVLGWFVTHQKLTDTMCMCACVYTGVCSKVKFVCFVMGNQYIYLNLKKRATQEKQVP